MKVKLLPLSADTWNAYLALCTHRNYMAQPPPPSGVWIAGLVPGAPRPFLFSGAALMPITGPDGARYIMLAHFVTNPLVPLRARHRAAEVTVETAKRFAACMGVPLIVPTPRGAAMRAFLSRRGFKMDPQAMYFVGGVLVEEKATAPKTPLPPEPSATRVPTVAGPAKNKKRGRR